MALVEEFNNIVKQLKLKVNIKSYQKENAFLVFDLVLNPGGTYRKLEKYSTEIALALKSISNPLIYPIQKEGVIRMEVMVEEQGNVLFNDISNNLFNTDFHLPAILGVCRKGSPIIIDLTTMPHLLMAGTTGSGKSIMLHSIINSLLFLDREVKLALIDTKRVEFSYYETITNLYCPIARNPEMAIKLLENLVEEMEKRFVKLEKAKCRDILNYDGDMSFIVVVIDEFADLMLASRKIVQNLICKLTQKSRACGIHIVLATQRPSVDVLTGLIKANFPSRISCQVSSSTDSRVVLGRGGAEKLVGKGDAIIDCVQYDFQRFKGCYLSEEDILEIVKTKKSWWSRIWSS